MVMIAGRNQPLEPAYGDPEKHGTRTGRVVAATPAPSTAPPETSEPRPSAEQRPEPEVQPAKVSSPKLPARRSGSKPPAARGPAKANAVKPASTQTSKAASRAECDPPYSIDANGRKIFKLECM
jgi:serine/threonine-protein kinase